MSDNTARSDRVCKMGNAEHPLRQFLREQKGEIAHVPTAASENAGTPHLWSRICAGETITFRKWAAEKGPRAGRREEWKEVVSITSPKNCKRAVQHLPEITPLCSKDRSLQQELQRSCSSFGVAADWDMNNGVNKKDENEALGKELKIQISHSGQSSSSLPAFRVISVKLKGWLRSTGTWKTEKSQNMAFCLRGKILKWTKENLRRLRSVSSHPERKVSAL